METKREQIHPLVKETRSNFNQGQISRREFLRYAMLLGTSSAVAYTLAACRGKGNAFTNRGEYSTTYDRSCHSYRYYRPCAHQYTLALSSNVVAH